MELALEWKSIFENLIYLGLAFVLSIPVAWDREKRSMSVGLRTYPLVSIGACAFILTGKSFLDVDGDAIARVYHGVITGMGFIGGGAILKNNEDVKGLAHAASLWSTGAIGAAVAFGRIEIAIVLSLTILLIFKIKDKVNLD